MGTWPFKEDKYTYFKLVFVQGINQVQVPTCVLLPGFPSKFHQVPFSDYLLE